jgi:hypothetical protein
MLSSYHTSEMLRPTQALRIPGITPAAVSLVNVYIEIFQRRAGEQASV